MGGGRAAVVMRRQIANGALWPASGVSAGDSEEVAAGFILIWPELKRTRQNWKRFEQIKSLFERTCARQFAIRSRAAPNAGFVWPVGNLVAHASNCNR